MLGLSENSHSTLAAVQAGTRGEDVRSAGSKGLSPGKLIEMSEGFATYTAATADVDQDGAGQAAAAAEFTKLLLDPKGSTLQDILVDETAKLGDAATRAALRTALVDSVLAKAAATALRTPKNFLENSPVANFIPAPLRAAFVDRPAELPELLSTLLHASAEDERIVATAQELVDALSKRSGGGDGFSIETLAAALRDTNTRATVTEQLPGLQAVGRRVGASLLRRAAFRTEQASVISETTRKALVDFNNNLAVVIDYDEDDARDS